MTRQRFTFSYGIEIAYIMAKAEFIKQNYNKMLPSRREYSLTLIQTPIEKNWREAIRLVF